MICFFKFPLENTLGGAEFHTLKLALHFRKRGEQIKLFTSDRFLFRLFEKNHLLRLRVFVGWEPTSKWALLLWPLTYLLARWKFRKLLEEIPPGSIFFMQSLIEKLILTPPTLTLSHEGRGNRKEFPSLDGRGKGRVIWLEHKIPGRWLKQNPLLPLYLKWARRVTIVTVSNFAKQEFVKLGVPEENIQVIYPGINSIPSSSPPYHGGENPLSLSPTPKGKGEMKEGVSKFTIGLLSRLDPEKGVYDFLKIILPQLAKHPAWKVLIAGEGPDKERIINIIDKYNLAERARLLGFVNNLDGFFSQISVLVYPSLVPESFGVAVLEAQARGIPVVASKIGALPEIIGHGENGFLVERGGNWLEYLIKLRDPNLYQALSQNAIATAQKFSEGKMLEAFTNLVKTDKLLS